MAEGEIHRKFRCPGCKQVFQFDAGDAGEITECVSCGTRLRLPGKPPPESPPKPPPLPKLDRLSSPAPTPPPLPRGERGRGSRSSRSAPRTPRARSRADRRRFGGSRSVDPDRWAKTYALVWGIVLIAGVVIPAIETQVTHVGYRDVVTESKLVWIMGGDADAGAVIALLATLGLGVLAVVGSRTLEGSFLGLTLFWAASATFLLYFVVSGSQAATGSLRIGSDMAGAVISMLLILFATPLIAAGNHMRKSARRSTAPRVLAGVGGIMLLLGFVMPVYSGHAMIELLFEESGWDQVTGIMLCLLGLLAYGILGIVSFGAAPMEGLALTMSWGARILMGLTVAVVVISFADEAPRDSGAMVLYLLKIFAIIYALLAILAVGLAAWLAPGLIAAEKAAMSRGRRGSTDRTARRF